MRLWTPQVRVSRHRRSLKLERRSCPRWGLYALKGLILVFMLRSIKVSSSHRRFVTEYLILHATFRGLQAWTAHTRGSLRTLHLHASTMSANGGSLPRGWMWMQGQLDTTLTKEYTSSCVGTAEFPFRLIDSHLHVWTQGGSPYPYASGQSAPPGLQASG